MATSSCDCCGRLRSDGTIITGTLRGLTYRYCGPACRQRHADAVLATGALCELCDLDAVGDTGRCDEHLDLLAAGHGAAEPRFQLAS